MMSPIDEATVDLLARELIDDECDEFSVAIGLDDFERVEARADEIEMEEAA